MLGVMLGLTLGINLASNIHSIVTQVVTSLMLGCQVFLKKCFHVPLSSRNTFIDKVCACGTGARTFHFASTQPPRRKQLYTLTYQLYPETRQLQPALAQLFSCAYQLYTPENGHRFLKSAHRFPIATAIPSPTTLCQYVEGVVEGAWKQQTDPPRLGSPIATAFPATPWNVEAFCRKSPSSDLGPLRHRLYRKRQDNTNYNFFNQL